MRIQEKPRVYATVMQILAYRKKKEEKEGKLISQDQITPTRHYCEKISLDSTQKQRNKEQFKHIVYPIPKEK